MRPESMEMVIGTRGGEEVVVVIVVVAPSAWHGRRAKNGERMVEAAWWDKCCIVGPCVRVEV